MNAADADGHDPRLAAWLAAWDDALAAGGSPPSPPPDLGPTLPPDWQPAVALMRRLRHALRPAGPSTDADPCTPPYAGEAVEAQRALPWAQLGRFELRRELGRGCCGIVYLAHDPLLQREVALKVPQVELALTPALRERFQREARVASALDHPNLVPVYEAGAVGPVVSSSRPTVRARRWESGCAGSTARCRSAMRPISSRCWPRHSSTPTAAASSIATSSPPTSSWRRPAAIGSSRA